MRNDKARDLLRPVQAISINNIPHYDYHLHTKWTDGKDSILDMYVAACEQNLQAVLFSEHVRKTSGEWFSQFSRDVRSMNDKRCMALVGIETRVNDFMGNLDCTEDMIEKSDLVVASVHRFPNIVDGSPIDFDNIDVSEALDIEYNLTMGLLDNDKVDILGHPFGMSISRYKVQPSDEKMLSVIKKAAKKGIAVEINAVYHSNLWQMINWCQESAALVSLGSDAHSTDDVGLIIRKLKGSEL